MINLNKDYNTTKDTIIKNKNLLNTSRDWDDRKELHETFAKDIGRLALIKELTLYGTSNIESVKHKLESEYEKLLKIQAKKELTFHFELEMLILQTKGKLEYLEEVLSECESQK